MSQTTERLLDDDLQEQERGTERSPVGIVAKGHDHDAVVRCMLRAASRGHSVLLAVERGAHPELIRQAEYLGARVIEIEPSHAVENPRDLLVGVAHQQSLEGLIVVDDPSRRIDFDRSVAALEDSFVTDGVLATAGAEIVVGIPAFEEEQAIGDVVTEAARHADHVIVVDDGSGDDTAEVAGEAGATVIEHERNRGYGAALQTVFETAEEAGVEHLAILDADGQHDPRDIGRLVEAQEESGAEIVIGNRFGENAETEVPLYRRFGLGVVNLLTNLSMGVARPRSYISDTQSGFRVYDSTAIESLANDDDLGEGMNASTDILYHGHTEDFEFEEVGTTIRYDVDDTSSHHPVSHGLQLVSNVLRTIEEDRPILAVGVPGFLSALIGLGFAYVTMSIYISTETFPLGFALTSSVFFLAGIFACFTAIILHSLDTHMHDNE